jgi:hypothetical protein
MTVAELKRLLADWPEVDEHGEDCEVWIVSRDGTSNVVHEAWPLNRRESEDGTKRWADLCLKLKP